MEFEEYRKYTDEIIREIFKGFNENHQLNKSTERSFLMEVANERVCYFRKNEGCRNCIRV